jgi:hypothetical protein
MTALTPSGAGATWSGAGVASLGDIDGDGRDDWIAGAPAWGDTVDGTGTTPGRAYVVHGTDSEGDASLSSGGTTLEGDQIADLFGYTVLGPGDLNGDGQSDVVVSGIRAGLERQGTVFLFEGPFTEDTLTVADSFGQWNPSNAAHHEFGLRLAAPDADGDDQVDLVFTAIVGTGAERGFVVELLHGPFPTGSATVPSPADLTVERVVSGTGSGVDHQFELDGSGDLDGDGRTDIVFSDPSASDRDGAVYLVAGARFGGESWTVDDVDATCFGAGAEELGHGIATGDFTGDGRDDLALGAPQWDGSGGEHGAVYILAPDLSTGCDPLASIVAEIQGPGLGDRVGYQLRNAGDVNTDGAEDLVFTVQPGGESAEFGGLVLVYGRDPLPSFDTFSFEDEVVYWGDDINYIDGATAGLISFDNPVTTEVLGLNSRTAVAAAGDVDGDRADDILVGLPASNVDGVGYGHVFVFAGGY